MKKIKISISRRWALLLCSVSAMLLTVSCRTSRKAQNESRQNEMRMQELQHEADSLQQILDSRRRALIYGTPDVMRRRAEENQAMQDRIDSINAELKKE